MSRSSTFGRSAISALALVLLAGVPAAVAQDAPSAPSAPKQPLKGDFAKPLTKQRGLHNADGAAKVVMSMVEDDGENKYSINVEGDEVSAEVNGEAVPAERIKRTDDKVIILGENGETLKEFAIGMPAIAGFGDKNEVRIRRFNGQGNAPRTFNFSSPNNQQPGGWIAAEPPKVMLGITMTSSDVGGINVDSVVDGLPAQIAGIKVGDRIVGIDDNEVESALSVRDILAKKEAGDELKIHVIRNGEKQAITVRLAKFNSEKLGSDVAPPTGLSWKLDPESPFGGAREELQKALKMLGKNESFKDAFKDDGARKDLSESLERALKSLESAQHNMGSGIAELLERHMVPGQNGGEMFFDSNRPDMIFRAPSAPDAPRALSGETDARLDRLMKKLDKLDKRLDELEKKLDAKN